MRPRPPVLKAFFGSASRNGLAARAALAGFCALGAASAACETWVDIPNGSSTALAVDADSVSLVEGVPYTMGAWFRYTYSLSIDCSPPRGCLAASQRVYYRANCLLGAITPVQEISFDLNGNVTRSDVNFDAVPYRPPLGNLEGLALRCLCLDYGFRYPGQWPTIGWSPRIP